MFSNENYKSSRYLETHLSYRTTSGFHTREGRIFMLVIFMNSDGSQEKLGLFHDCKSSQNRENTFFY